VLPPLTTITLECFLPRADNTGFFLYFKHCYTIQLSSDLSWYRFVLISNFLGAELAFSTGAELSWYHTSGPGVEVFPVCVQLTFEHIDCLRFYYVCWQFVPCIHHSLRKTVFPNIGSWLFFIYLMFMSFCTWFISRKYCVTVHFVDVVNYLIGFYQVRSHSSVLQWWESFCLNLCFCI
jgi:hypothetical protein